MKPKFYFRNYQKGDFDKVLVLWKETGLGDAWRGDNETVIMRTLKSNGKFIMMLNSGTEELIGTSWITNDGRRLYLHHFGIARKYQGKGLSKYLLEKSLDFARATGLQMKLEVHKDNILARRLYEHYAFNYLGDYLVYIIRQYNG